VVALEAILDSAGLGQGYPSKEDLLGDGMDEFRGVEGCEPAAGFTSNNPHASAEWLSCR